MFKGSFLAAALLFCFASSGASECSGISSGLGSYVNEQACLPDSKLSLSPMVELGLATTHFKPVIEVHGEPYRMNNSNHIVGLGASYGYLTMGFSAFKNSFSDPSVMLSADYKLFSFPGDVSLDVGLGVVSGYDPEIQDGIYIGKKYLIASFITAIYSPDWLNIGGVKIAPKLRIMGADALILGVEFRA